MPKTARDDPKAPSDRHPEGAGGWVTSHYAPGTERPLASYAILAATYSAIFGSSLIALRARGHELPTRIAIGELLVCPYCLAQWAASGLTLGLVGAPRFTRLVSSRLVAHTISDFLQVAYRAAEDQL